MNAQSPMLSCPLKHTIEIDWIAPLKQFIRESHDCDPDAYTVACVSINKLRQDACRNNIDAVLLTDLLRQYYGQLELLDLRFPVDENGVKISFLWFDAFTHTGISQQSIAYEKASIVFNMSAILSWHAAQQDRSNDLGSRTAHRSFQASAGMFEHVGKTFLHAPSLDLNRRTVNCLAQLMLGQAQETFLETQIASKKEADILARLASQGAYLYGQALHAMSDNAIQASLDKLWPIVTRIKQEFLISVAQYYQALVCVEAKKHSIAIRRLRIAETQACAASRLANSFASSILDRSVPMADAIAALASLVRKHVSKCQKKLADLTMDITIDCRRDMEQFEALMEIPRLQAARTMLVDDLYQDVQHVIGPDIFQTLTPLAVVKAASLYDEEKAKLIRKEIEIIDMAEAETEYILQVLKLPSSLDVLAGVINCELPLDLEFESWCKGLTQYEKVLEEFKNLAEYKREIGILLKRSKDLLDMEVQACETMRIKHGDKWTQQPSSEFTAPLCRDIEVYRRTIKKAGADDATLYASLQRNKSAYEKMQKANDKNDVASFYQSVLIEAGLLESERGGSHTYVENDIKSRLSVIAQVAAVGKLLEELQSTRDRRRQVLSRMRNQARQDDISNKLMLCDTSNLQETQIFAQQLLKYQSNQQCIQNANEKEKSLLRDIIGTQNMLLSDTRVHSERPRIAAYSSCRHRALQTYRKVFRSFVELCSSLQEARKFYIPMLSEAKRLHTKIEAFSDGRRIEGRQLLRKIEDSNACYP